MVYINIFGLECGTAGDAVFLRAERIYKGGAGSRAEDAARDWKPDAKSANAAKAAVGGTKMWKSAFKMTVSCSPKAEGGPGSPAIFMLWQGAAMAMLEKHGLAGSLKTSWRDEVGSATDVAEGKPQDDDDNVDDDNDDDDDNASLPAWAGVKIKADPSGLSTKKLIEELRSACTNVVKKK